MRFNQNRNLKFISTTGSKFQEKNILLQILKLIHEYDYTYNYRNDIILLYQLLLPRS